MSPQESTYGRGMLSPLISQIWARRQILAFQSLVLLVLIFLIINTNNGSLKSDAFSNYDATNWSSMKYSLC